MILPAVLALVAMAVTVAVAGWYSRDGLALPLWVVAVEMNWGWTDETCEQVEVALSVVLR